MRLLLGFVPFDLNEYGLVVYAPVWRKFMELLMTSRSEEDAVQALDGFVVGNPLCGGGPVTPSTYNGWGFLVDRVGLPPTFEFPSLFLFTFSTKFPL